MEKNRPLDNMEEKRTFDPKEEKRTLENNRERGGLNEGNPNTDSTPVSNERIPNMTGGVGQSNYEDEKEGRVHRESE